MSPDTRASLEARLLAAVARVRPVAEAHARDAERDRTLHPEVVAALRREGLFALAAPRAVGGDEADARTQLAVYEAMAHADASAGWCLMIGAVETALMAAYLPDAAVRAVFAGAREDPARTPIAAGLQMALGRARPVGGGFEVTGRWAFGSGIRHADWVFTAAVVEGAEPTPGPPPMIQFAVPAARVTIEPTWDTAGLRGSGSDHYRMEAVYVDAGFTCPFPFAPRRRGGPFFDLPFLAQVAPAHAGVALGLARRALDEIAAIAPRRIQTWTQAPLAAEASFRLDLGRARIRLEAAAAMAREVMDEMTARAASGAALTPADWARIRGITAHATDTAADACTFAYRAGGASALYADSLLQRTFRDVHAAAQHIAAQDDAYEQAGAVFLGESPAHPLFLPRAAAMV